MPPDWMRRRNHVLKRDARICKIQDPMCISVATEVDHIGDRMNHSEGNLRAACKPCHQNRSSGQGGAAAGRMRRAMASQRRRPPEAHPGIC